MSIKRALSLVAFLSYSLYSRVNASQIPFEVPVTTTAPTDPTYTLVLPYATYLGNLNTAADILVFSNVRYAAAPTGTLRWQTPQTPSPTPGIQDGSVGGNCFNATPGWFGKGSKDDGANVGFPRPGGPEENSPQEDCLFLDVFVPRASFVNPPTPGLPVVFWIYGGGYVEGSKDPYDGTPLLQASGNSIIYVRANYRLGAFGFLASSSLTSNGGIANAGFWDQRAAFEWIVSYIGKVGGDSNQITAMGESAGAGSIMHHITAPNSLAPAFQRAIIQSPAFFPQYDDVGLVAQFNAFATAANCTGTAAAQLECLRGQDSPILQTANALTVQQAPDGQFVYGPAIDGNYVPDLPGLRLQNGNFNKDVNILVGHTADEGAVFTPTGIDFDTWLQDTFPSVPAGFDANVTLYYPKSPTSRYSNEAGRFGEVIGESAITCNTLYLANATRVSPSYGYEYAVGMYPYHGLDLCWTFAPNFKLQLKGVNICTSLYPGNKAQFQRYLVNFAMAGDPNSGQSQPKVNWNAFGTTGSVLKIQGIAGFSNVVDDEVPKDRCGFWQNATYCTTCSSSSV